MKNDQNLAMLFRKCANLLDKLLIGLVFANQHSIAHDTQCLKVDTCMIISSLADLSTFTKEKFGQDWISFALSQLSIIPIIPCYYDSILSLLFSIQKMIESEHSKRDIYDENESSTNVSSLSQNQCIFLDKDGVEIFLKICFKCYDDIPNGAISLPLYGKKGIDYLYLKIINSTLKTLLCIESTTQLAAVMVQTNVSELSLTIRDISDFFISIWTHCNSIEFNPNTHISKRSYRILQEIKISIHCLFKIAASSDIFTSMCQKHNSSNQHKLNQAKFL